MTRRRFTWIMAAVLCFVLGLAGMSSAVDSSSPYHVSKWESIAANTTMYSVFSDYYYVNSSEYTWRKFNSNCFYFARWVTNRLSNVDFKLQTEDMRGIVLYGGHVKGVGSLSGKSVGEIATLLGQHLNDVSGLPSEQQVRNIFANAQAGDVIQFVGWSNAGQHTMIIAQKYDNGFDTLEGNNPKNSVANNYLSYGDFRNRIAAAGSRGGFSVYHFGTPPEIPSDPTISEGLRNLTSSKYAKVYTAEWDQYNELYSDSELSRRLSGNWIAYHEECRIIGVGRNSKGIVYARIYFPLDNGKLKEGYVDLKKAFVPNMFTKAEGVKKTVAVGSNLHKRAARETKIAYAGITAGSDTYLLAETNGWCVVLYPTSARNEWRIVWMTAEDYGAMFNEVPVITNLGNLPQSVVAGTSYRNAITATGSTPITWSTSAGTLPSSQSYLRTNLPPGLSISGTGTTGTISGTVGHTDAGRSSYMPLFYYFNITATNSRGSSAPKASNITVWEPPVFETSSTLARGDLNKRYSQTIKAKGTEFTMHWKIIEGKLPPGLTFSAKDSKREATITGVPTQTGVFRFKVRLYNLVGNTNTTTTREFIIPVGNVATEYYDSRIKLNLNFLSGRAGNKYYDWTGITDSSSSGTKNLDNYIFSVSSGSLPAGLSIEEKSAFSYNVGKVYLSGIPQSSGTYDFTLKAKRISDGGYNTKSYRLTISPATTTTWRDSSMSLRGGFAQNKMMRVNYRSASVYVRGGSPSYTPSLVNGELPPGTRLEQSGNYVVLVGVPKKAGKFNFTIRVTGRNGGYTQQSYTVNIATNPYYKSGSSTGASKPKFSSKEIPDVEAGSEWEATLECSGTEPIAWSAVSELPEWMTLDEETGRISGIPMTPGKYKFKIKAENEIGSVTKTFKVKVVKAAPTIVTSSLPDGVKGFAYEARLEAFGTDPIKWSKVGKFPSGLKLDKKLGIIYGTPKQSKSFDITVKAKNKAGSETATFKIRILPTDDSVEEGKDDDEADDDDDEESGDTVTALPSVATEVSAQPEPETSGQSGGIVLTRLYVVSGDERLEGSVTAEAGKPLTFEIGQWQDESGRNIDVSDAVIFVNDEAVSADISEEGLFTLPAETVKGELVVYVSAQSGGREFRTLEVNATADSQYGVISASEAGNDGSNSASSSSSGCNAGVIGVMGLIFAGIFAFGKKSR